tara:strand:- start:104 stop:358 length:255 start_codon:yes stop_codon:yes gene_type:complete
MKKILFILTYLPFIGFGQDLKEFNKCDIIVNQVLENTARFIKDRNTPKTEFRFYLNNQKSSINWNKERFSKWQIIDKKRKIIYK